MVQMGYQSPSEKIAQLALFPVSYATSRKRTANMVNGL